MDPGIDGETVHCEDISDLKMEYTNVATKTAGYLIEYSDGAGHCESETRKILNKMNPLLDCGYSNDIFGGKNGIYTWLLCYLNNKFVIYFKRTIIANEIRSKHGDIVDDVCNDSFISNKIKEFDTFYGGEVKIDGSRFTFNFLSGTYSLDRIDINPENKVKDFITEMMKSGKSDIIVDFDVKGVSFIQPFTGETKITDAKLLELINEGVGLDVYKFDLEKEEELEVWNKIRSLPNKKILKAKHSALLEFQNRLNTKVKPSANELKNQEIELAKFLPISDEILKQYKMHKTIDSYQPSRKKSKYFKSIGFKKNGTRNKYKKIKLNRKRLAKFFSF